MPDSVPIAEVEVPAREGRGLQLSAGQGFRVYDVAGQQCGDVFAFCADDVREYVSAEHTRVHVSGLFPRVGEQFVTNRRRPLLTLEADSSPGKHDMLIAACDPERFALLGVEGWHASCQENLLTVMRDFGFAEVEVPQPINIFTNIPVDSEGRLGWEPAASSPGDSITFRVERDAYVVVSACPQDIVQINALEPGPLKVEVLDR